LAIDHRVLRKGGKCYKFDDPEEPDNARGDGINDHRTIVGWFLPAGNSTSESFKATYQPGGLIEPIFRSAGAYPLALYTYTDKKTSDDRPDAWKIPVPKGAKSTLAGNAASSFPAEPTHFSRRV